VQAIVMGEFGPPEVLVLREVADPMCGPGQLMIEVSFSSVTFVESQVRSGRAPHVSMLPRLPAVPGNGVAGVVVAVGPDVGNAVIGARVVSTTGGPAATPSWSRFRQTGSSRFPARSRWRTRRRC
jgi:NADPH:quinone reductase